MDRERGKPATARLGWMPRMGWLLREGCDIDGDGRP